MKKYLGTQKDTDNMIWYEPLNPIRGILTIDKNGQIFKYIVNPQFVNELAEECC